MDCTADTMMVAAPVVAAGQSTDDSPLSVVAREVSPRSTQNACLPVDSNLAEPQRA